MNVEHPMPTRAANRCRRWLPLMLLMAVAGVARAQSFPFNDAFASYPPGSTGAPAWSILDGAFNAANGRLQAPITLRYNGRPPTRFTVEATVRLNDGPSEAGGLLASAGFVFNMQHDANIASSDHVAVVRRNTKDGESVAVEFGADTPAVHRLSALTFEDPMSDDVRIRLVVDAESGRYAFFVGDKPALLAAPAEYAAGLFAIRLRGAATLDDLVLRAPTEDEGNAVRSTTLFNDPRDIAAGDDGHILVLTRANPSVLVVTPDGEVVHRFARRLPGSVPDPVALSRGNRGEVLILNRFPAEVVAYDRNGGFRYRFGAGVLQEPSDLAVRPNGVVYVADPAARSIFAFDATGRALGAVSRFGDTDGVPTRVAIDALHNLVVSLDGGARSVTLRPGPDNVTTTLIREDKPGAADFTVAPNGETWALADGVVTAWPRASQDAVSFTGAALGGLEANGRLARCGDHVALLERARARVVLVPDDLRDMQPSVTMQNVSDTAAIVRWNSMLPVEEARARILRGTTWETVTVHHKEPMTKHQVLLERLTPGTTYRYEVTPGPATVPPVEWTAPFTFNAGKPAAESVGGSTP